MNKNFSSWVYETFENFKHWWPHYLLNLCSQQVVNTDDFSNLCHGIMGIDSTVKPKIHIFTNVKIFRYFPNIMEDAVSKRRRMTSSGQVGVVDLLLLGWHPVICRAYRNWSSAGRTIALYWAFNIDLFWCMKKSTPWKDRTKATRSEYLAKLCSRKFSSYKP